MNDLMINRGPDEGGSWSDARAGLVLGHRRLAIIDLSPRGRQPMASNSGDCIIVFNGEIYNFREIRDELCQQGVMFQSRSDTEVILEGYRRWGDDVVSHLVGMFAFALWDVARRRLLLARDRCGEKPLYYTKHSDLFAFASELQPLLSLDVIDGAIDKVGMALYLGSDAVPAPHSIVQGVHKLAAGHLMIISPDRIELRRYWDPVTIARQEPRDITLGDAVSELDMLLGQAVKQQVFAERPLGAFLSGGIDSSLIVARAASVLPDAIRTFTVGFDDKKSDEAPYAAAVAGHIGTNHTTHYMTADSALNLVSDLPKIYGEPFSDAAALPTVLMADFIRANGITVVLTGDGGDECFGGYPHYTTIGRIALLMRLAGLGGHLGRAMVGRLPGKFRRLAPLVGLPEDRIYRSLTGSLNEGEIAALVGFLPEVPEWERCWSTIRDRPFRTRAMVADMLTNLPEVLLVKVDRAAMSRSIETRSPFLDHRIVEFALRLPERMIVDKAIVRQLAYAYVPRRLLDRRKQGFNPPYARWLRGPLAPMLRDLVTPARLTQLGFETFAPVGKMLDDHLSGRVNFGRRLWSLLVLSLWHEWYCNVRSVSRTGTVRSDVQVRLA